MSRNDKRKARTAKHLGIPVELLRILQSQGQVDDIQQLLAVRLSA